MTKVSIQTPPERTDFVELRDFWQVADGLHFHAAYTFDHLVPLFPGEGPNYCPDGNRSGSQLDGWLLLGALAASTERLNVGTLVTDATLRPPAVLAKMAVSLDHITGGRAVLGVGAGWHATEHRMFGIPFPTASERVARLAETLEIAIALMQTEGPVTYAGSMFRLDEAYFEPKPIRGTIPIMVGGASRRVKALAAQYANVINTFASAREWPTLNDELDGLLAAHRRHPTELVRSAYVFADISGVPAREERLLSRVSERAGISVSEASTRVVTARPDQARTVLAGLFGAGVDEVVLGLSPPYNPEALERFATEVLPSADHRPVTTHAAKEL
jgi:alkanesulfonate monooxygenase SsuD/methylene tetrahydromethanopterin reductase-like flavin-dependent oxidoreductase (luciferase family)